MHAKLVLVTLVVGMAGGLSACSTPGGPPRSATDCAYAAPLPKHWIVGTGEGCQHFRPAGRYYTSAGPMVYKPGS